MNIVGSLELGGQVPDPGSGWNGLGDCVIELRLLDQLLNFRILDNIFEETTDRGVEGIFWLPSQCVLQGAAWSCSSPMIQGKPEKYGSSSQHV